MLEETTPPHPMTVIFVAAVLRETHLDTPQIKYIRPLRLNIGGPDLKHYNASYWQ